VHAARTALPRNTPNPPCQPQKFWGSRRAGTTYSVKKITVFPTARRTNSIRLYNGLKAEAKAAAVSFTIWALSVVAEFIA